MTEREELDLFKKLIDENRYDFSKLVYIIFPFGQKGHALEHKDPYPWQFKEWDRLSRHLADPTTRRTTYRLIISSGNGAAKTAFGAMTYLMLMYTQHVKGRITANTEPQMTSVIWPEYDAWFRHARFVEHFFEKFGKSIKAKDPEWSEVWRLDAVTWDENRPASLSGMHNKGECVIYIFEEAPGIPAVVWDYTRGAFADAGTIRIHLAFGNSDDPNSKFEQNMTSPLWHSTRLDCRELPHMDKTAIEDVLFECNGNEDHDEFRVRVRGLPRKSAKDSIIDLGNVDSALARAKGFDRSAVEMLPVVLTCDPAWTGGDDTCIGYRQGQYSCLLEKFKLDKTQGHTHALTYNRLCHWEKELGADAVFIDQGEGTALYTMAINNQKTNWFLINFANSPTDKPDPKESEYANIRAQIYYEFDKFLREGGILDVHSSIDQQTREEWIETIRKQLCYTKGQRHKITGKKLCEAKIEIKSRVGCSPDVADCLVLSLALPIMERLPENQGPQGNYDRFQIGEGAYRMPAHGDLYADMDQEPERNDDLYD